MAISFDGKTIRSTGKTDRRESPTSIVSACVADAGLTLAGLKADGKSNEIPAARELISLLEVEGCMIAADAMRCQKETAGLIVEKKADCLLNAKDNQPRLKKDIEESVGDDALRNAMDVFRTLEKNGGRLETRAGFVTHEAEWLAGAGWKNLSCAGAMRRQFERKGQTSDERHCYISSRKLAAEELLRRVRLEWSVESMHWLLDAHFGEDFCRVEDENARQALNVARKIATGYSIRMSELIRKEHNVSTLMYHIVCPAKYRRVVISEEVDKKHEVEKKLWGGEFWTRGYYIGMVGEHGSEQVIREYVRKQGRNMENYQKLHEGQLDLFP